MKKTNVIIAVLVLCLAFAIMHIGCQKIEIDDMTDHADRLSIELEEERYTSREQMKELCKAERVIRCYHDYNENLNRDMAVDYGIIITSEPVSEDYLIAMGWIEEN